LSVLGFRKEIDIRQTTGAHLWANRFDGSLEDVFELQDQVAISVAGVIEPALQAAEIRRSADRPTSDLTAYDLYLQALAHFPSEQGIVLHSTCSGVRSNAIRIMPPLSQEQRFATCDSTSVAGAKTLTKISTRGLIWRSWLRTALVS
jgi:hypothetical protein